MKRVLLQPAYLLHRRSYRETSFLIELLTQEHGRISLIAKGVRKARSPLQGLLQSFHPLLVSWAGNGELVTLSHVETNGEGKRLTGESLFAGLYLNELLMRLLQKWDAHPVLYASYEKTITTLQTQGLQEKTLRSFEKNLLEELGYGLLPKSDISLHNSFSPERYYRFIPEQGFVLCEQTSHANNIFSGKSLLAIAKEDWQDEENLRAAKRLIRFVMAPLLGSRPIYSRQLFMQPHERSKHEEE